MGHRGVPAVPSSFVGRGRELEEFSTLVRRHRLVSVLGPGGVGKTRLVSQWLGSIDERLAGFVDLGPLPDQALLATVVLRACGITEEPGWDPVERLAGSLGGTDAILVLDTCEHLRQHVAAFVESILLHCPSLRILVTSRVALGVIGEAVLPLNGLGADGVALFVDRVGLVQPGITVDEEHARAICELVDGLPLGIELAAAHARAISLADIRSGMADRLSFLLRRGSAVAERHLSIEASIGWSYELLDEPSRRALRALSVLPGLFTSHASRALLKEEVSTLETLVDHSMVQFDVGDDRYVLLDTVRDYAARELETHGEDGRARRELLSWAASLAESVGPMLTRGDPEAVRQVERDEDGIEAALTYAVESVHLLGAAADVVTNLTFYWSLRGRCTTGAQWAKRVVGELDEPSPGLMWSCAFLSAYSGDLEAAVDWAQRLPASVSDDEIRYRGRALIVVGMVGLFDRPSTAVPVLTEAVEITQRCADRWGQVEALQMLAYAHLLRSEASAASAHLDAALEPLDELRHGQLRAWDACARADVAYLQSQFLTAVDEGRRAIALADSIGEPVSASGALRPLVAALCQLGRADEASVELRSAEASLGADPVLMNREIVLAGQATVALWRDPKTAATAARAAWAAATNSGLGWLAAETGTTLAVAQLAAGDTREAQASADIAVQCARQAEAQAAEAGAAFAWCVLNRSTGLVDPTEASGRAHVALQTASELGILSLVAEGLDVAAGFAVDADRVVAAAQLHAASDRLRAELGCVTSPLVLQFRKSDEHTIAAQLSPDELDEARQQGAKLSAPEAVSYASRSRGRRRRPRHGWESLTPTEHEVVNLVSRGLSNGQIGSALLIGEGTVRTHLRSIFAKLGFRSRTQLAAEAVRRRE